MPVLLILALIAPLVLNVLAATESASAFQKCSNVASLGILELPFRPAYLAAEEFDGQKSLFVSSFFNIELAPPGSPPPPFVYVKRDLVAQVFDVTNIENDNFPFGNPNIRELTDLGVAPGQVSKTVWPNALIKAPKGVFPFEALVSAQGFHIAPLPGRLVAIDMDNLTEYVIAQSSQLPTGFNASNPYDPSNSPRFYHTAVFYDMDADGKKDIIAVRSGLRAGRLPYPPLSELVWFRNPGDDLTPNGEWTETILHGGTFPGLQGPDIDLQMRDLDGDGVPEFVATHAFASTSPDAGKITIYGAPAGGDWSQVDASNSTAPKVRTKDLVTNQGRPFSIELVDLNGDKRIDILATNHQPDGSEKFTSQIPGRVFAVEQPIIGDIFTQDWTTHVLLDNIRPNPSLLTAQISRTAPGFATVFYPQRRNKRLGNYNKKPWILVGGDEASKVWIMKPKNENRRNWEYHAKVILDINDFYGANTTQSSPQGIGFSSIGKTIVIPSKKKVGDVLVLVPVFEAKEVHVFRVTNSCPCRRCAAQ